MGDTGHTAEFRAHQIATPGLGARDRPQLHPLVVQDREGHRGSGTHGVDVEGDTFEPHPRRVGAPGHADGNPVLAAESQVPDDQPPRCVESERRRAQLLDGESAQHGCSAALDRHGELARRHDTEVVGGRAGHDVFAGGKQASRRRITGHRNRGPGIPCVRSARTRRGWAAHCGI